MLMSQPTEAQVFDKIEKAFDKLTGADSEPIVEKPAYSLETSGNTKGMTVEFKDISFAEHIATLKFVIKSGNTPYDNIRLSLIDGIQIYTTDNSLCDDVLLGLNRKWSTKSVQIEIKPRKKYELKIRVFELKGNKGIGKILIPIESESSRFEYTFVFKNKET